MINWLIEIFSETNFLPHRFCIGGSVWLLSVSVISNILIFLSYFSIPVVLAYLIRKRSQQDFKYTLWLFAAFIFACGITHLFHAITYWQPWYWLQATLDALTAIISVYTAIYLWPLLPKLLNLPSPEQLLELNRQLQAEIKHSKLIDAARQEALERLQKIANHVPGLVYQFRLNPDGTSCFPYASPAIHDIYRVSPEEVQKSAVKVFAILHPDDYQQVMASISSSAQKLTPWQQEYRVQFEDGTVRWLLGNALPQREDDGSTLWHGFITDITERKHKEIEYKTIIQASFNGFWCSDYSGRFLEVNTALCKMLGYSEQELLNMTIMDIEAIESSVDTASRIQKIIQTGRDTFETRHRHKDGTIIDVEVNVLYEAVLGQRFFTFINEITERKRTENEVLKTKNQLQATLNAIPDLMFEIDLEGYYHNFQAHRTDLLAAQPERILGKNITEILPADASAICFAALQEALQQGWSTGKQIQLELTQGTYWFELSVAIKPTENGQLPHFIVLSRDITERKQSEAEMAESRNLLRAIIDTVPVRIFWKDCNLHYLGCNKAFANDAGMNEPNELIGKDDYQMGWKDQAELYRADDKTVIDLGMAKLSYDEPQTTPNGQTIWIRTSKVPLKNQNNETMGLLGVYEDITERKQMEEKLRENESHLSTIIENEPECIKIMDAQGRLKQMNPAGLAMIEADSLEQVAGKAVLNLIAPEYRAAYVELHKRVIGGETRQLEYEVIGLKGGRRWLETHAVPMLEHDQVVHLAVSRDITQRKQAEQQLRELNRDFVTFLENTSDFIYFKDQHSRIRFCSQTLANITHYHSWRDLIGKHDFEIFPPDTAQIYYQEELSVFSQGQPLINKVNPYYNEDGSKGWVSTSKWPVFDFDNRKVIGIFGISRDITQLKKTEQNLQESELMLKEAQEIAHLGHWILDIPNNKLYWSDEIYRIFGLLPQEFAVSYQTFLKYIHPEDRSYVEYSYNCHLLSKAHYEIEYRILLKDGTIKYVIEKCKTEFNQLNEPLCSVGVILDITGRKQAEELLQEKTAALLRSNADLEQFAYSVSHDMRQPLRSVAGHLQLLSRSLKDKLDEDERENLNFALEGAKRMDAMILSLLDYSRVGRKTESKAWISSRAALAEALEFLTPAIADAQVEVKITGDWGQVFASYDELTRLFMNLISNAIKYREADQSPRIEVDSVVTDELWRVSVRDYGIGINPQQIERLFQFFSRLQSRTRFEGTGMGLALCRRIVEHHGGRIWAESAGEGLGSCFIFELPRLESGKAELTA